jgi:Protein of unknown function (DUF4011)/REase_MTES_1575/AAA domain/Protein of unknown function (DUF3320)
MDEIAEKLDQARRSLLDLTRRNRLINFKPRGRTSLQIVDEIPANVFRILVADQKTMQFLPLEESDADWASDTADLAENWDDLDEPAGLPFSDLPEFDEAGPLADRHTDLYLQTALTGEKLQRRLLHLSREAESALQERGCNILFLVIGLLQWTEREDSTITSRAPIVLVPVELVRETVKNRFKIRLFDDEPVLNPSLVQLCHQKFGMGFPEFDPGDDDSVNRLFGQVEAGIADQTGWSLIPEIHLGLFSFAKILMYLDLDDKRWPAENAISRHPILRTLMGFRDDGRAPPDVLLPEEMDDKVSPHETFQVVDADSSQQVAILAAKRGQSMVIEGPPGTGKSQTITNIVAECLSEGKTVLFVAEKSAALQVVKRRLGQVGLGNFVTELHSRKASKKAFMDELGRSMASEHAVPERVDSDADRLAQLRTQLNRYVRTLHQLVPPLNISLYEAIGRSAALQVAPEAPFDLPDVASWDNKRLTATKELISALSGSAERVGNPLMHPWRGTGERNVPLHVRQQLPQLLKALETSIQNSVISAKSLAETVLAESPVTREGCVDLIADARLITDGSCITADGLRNPAWDTEPSGLREVLSDGERLEELRAELDGRWANSSEDEDWSAVAARRSSSGSWFRWLTPRWWMDASRIRRHRTPKEWPGESAVKADFVVLQKSRETKLRILREEDRWTELFGSLWKGAHSDWPQLKSFTRTMLRVRQQILKNPAAQQELCKILGDNEKRQTIREATQVLVSILKRVKEEWRTLRDALEIDGEHFLGEKPDRAPFERWIGRIREASEARESLADWAAYSRAIETCQSHGLESFLTWTDGAGSLQGPETWRDSFERQFIRLWLDTMTRSDPVIREFRGGEQAQFIEEFGEVDRRWLELSRSRLASRIAKRRPRIGQSVAKNSGLSILEAELRRKRRHKPIRRLLASSAGGAIQRITPCFMMSPISIAQFLDPNALKFDVVIFDEASQVEWADAVGAIARGSQLILVGDEKQLPPTNFFGTVDSSTEEDESDELAIGDLESVLAVGQTCLGVRTMLRWHYRSRHDSLISFSNSEFYDNQLRTFPGPSIGRSEFGVSFRHISDGVYLRSKGRFNRVEAKAVARAVIEHATTAPNLTLGVGAFSKAQQNAIEDEVELLRRLSTDPTVGEFFTDEKDEPFFVKNLETIQGDERDVIYLSVGYGPDEAGRFTMNFGPINKEGGWRRLNVLVTRSRRRCVVFSSVVSEDIRVETGSPRGVHALKRYLKYAEEGTLPIDVMPQGGFDSPFEESVYEALRNAGWDIHSQIGCAGFSIDLGVIDPRTPGRYLCGIECDGATYHSSATARDRDRLRQDVLENLGWRIIRVWSTDWFHQPETTLARLLEQVNDINSRPIQEVAPNTSSRSRAKDHANVASPEVQRSSPTQVDAKATTAQSNDGPPPGIERYKRFSGRLRGDRDMLLRTSVAALTELFDEIVNVEGPIHQNELVRIVATLYGARVTGSVKKKLAGALNMALEHQMVRHDMFMWPRTMTRPLIRWRGGEDAVTSADLICPEEVAEAAAWVVEHEFGIPRDDLPAATIRAMGFKRIGSQLAELAEQGVRLATDRKLVAMDANGMMVCYSGEES